MHARTWRGAVALGLSLSLLATACGDDDDTATDDTTSTSEAMDDMTDGETVELATLDIGTSETTDADGKTTYAFDLPEGVTAGTYRLNLDNSAGTEAHHFQLYRLFDGTAIEDVQAALAEEDIATLMQLGAFTGGTGPTDPGAESAFDAIVDLEEGTYLLLCFLPDADGAPHAANGMVAPMEVGPADPEMSSEAPEAGLTLSALDFAFDQDTIEAGTIIEFVNTSESQVHEASVVHLPDGVTLDDVFAFFSGEVEGPPPFHSVGGAQAIMPGASMKLTVDADPGTYALLCFVPDPSDGVPHIEKGMVQVVTVV